MQAIPVNRSIFEAPVTAEAQKALTDALGVYDLSDGFKSLKTVELPSAPLKIVTSPKGLYFAAVYAYEVMIYDLEDQKKIVNAANAEFGFVGCVFLTETKILYAGIDGVTAYDLETQSIFMGR